MFNLFRKRNIPEKVNYLTFNYLIQKENRDNNIRKINIPDKVNYLTFNYVIQKENRENNITKYIKESREKSLEKFKNKDVVLLYKINNLNQMNLIKNNKNN
jgi:hypothetical protein